jgi:hypothetical protein
VKKYSKSFYKILTSKINDFNDKGQIMPRQNSE